MVRLQNIGRDSRYIWCDYYPESENEPGYIKVDLESEEIVEIISAPYEEKLNISTYSHHAMIKLIAIQNRQPLPTVTGAAWY